MSKISPPPPPLKKKKNIIIQYIMKNLELYVNTLVNFSTEDRYTCSEFIPTDMKNIEFVVNQYLCPLVYRDYK